MKDSNIIEAVNSKRIGDGDIQSSVTDIRKGKDPHIQITRRRYISELFVSKVLVF
jgi:hypothetical protein